LNFFVEDRGLLLLGVATAFFGVEVEVLEGVSMTIWKFVAELA
jgi:hypothetical protein